MTAETQVASNDFCRILSLDGGGTKGFYTIGVLKELEAMAGGLLCEHFDLIFGTSTTERVNEYENGQDSVISAALSCCFA